MAVRSAGCELELLELLEVTVQHSAAVLPAGFHRAVNLPQSSTLMLVRTPDQRGHVVFARHVAPGFSEAAAAAHE